MTRRIVLHVGLPKTGTTALQVWADANRAALRDNGIDYPEMRIPSGVPNHSAILRQAIMEDRFDGLKQVVKSCQSPTLFLSSEGLTNHLYDFHPMALTRFRKALEAFQVMLLLVVREAEAWTRSMHAQAVLNPPNVQWGYATELPLEDFRELPRVLRFLNQAALREDLVNAFSPASVAVVQYEDGWLAPLQVLLGISDDSRFSKPARIHESISAEGIEIMRQVNGMLLAQGLRMQFQALLQAVLNSSHSILLTAARNFAGVGLTADKLAPVLGELNARTPEEIDLVMRLKEELIVAAQRQKERKR